MKLPPHKTKIVATIGPASSEPAIVRAMVRAGMNVARLNFSHGTFEGHARVISMVREAAEAEKMPVAIMADLPGPKMRIGEISGGPVELVAGDQFTITVDECDGDAGRVSTVFRELPGVVGPGVRLFLNDGLVQLVVESVVGGDVHCVVEVGGPLSSRKGLNLPGVKLGISAFTARDRECMEFALSQGVDAISQSFVESAADMLAVRDAAAALGAKPFLIAKIERREALENHEEILQASDGIMVARGDLGVEVAIHEMAVTQKRLIAAANRLGRPVITATQMLESMTASRLPTRAEVSDVANAILDGTDCVMLSGESAAGRFPVESVAMLAAIAGSAEGMQGVAGAETSGRSAMGSQENPRAFLANRALEFSGFDAVLVPTDTGRSARFVAQSRLPVWILAVGEDENVLGGLNFSRGVVPVRRPGVHGDWGLVARELNVQLGLRARDILLVVGRSARDARVNRKLELLQIDGPGLESTHL